MATKQSTEIAAGINARAVHVGINVAKGTYNAGGATLSASDQKRGTTSFRWARRSWVMMVWAVVAT